ncbi:hypothetical protein [Micromonospora sp. CB01531]|uniref:hypothetical protein n=1 Tax=Micromonospora sp. CB01531 TaxID=1718947 RepID=UPI00093A458A|nr:hypothetical protein [Micromonospora sp. CB01531]OKI51410.1 hypothetical protein A6A27_33590 [Micromonospora sp. CB01531]
MKFKSDVSSADLDQLWRDMQDYDQRRGQRPPPHLIIPKLNPASERSLAHMVAIFRQLTGRSMKITVRETGP